MARGCETSLVLGVCQEMIKKKAEKTFREGYKCYGLNACLALFNKRPAAIIRAYIASYRVAQAKDIMKHCVAAKLAYHIVSEAELDQIAGSKHHEGLCLIVTAAKALPWSDVLQRLKQRDKALLIFATGVTNPHNIGAILRSAAHFGADALAVSSELLPLSGAAYRVAEGGAEAVELVAVAAEPARLAEARALGFSLIATSSHAQQSAATLRWPRHSILLLGAEGEGLGDNAQRASHHLVTIPGTGHVESLNVSAAAAVLLAYWRLAVTPSR